MKDSTIIYRSFYEAMSGLDKEVKADLWEAIFELSLNFKEIELTGIANNMFQLIKPQIYANIAKYKNGCKGRDVQVNNRKLNVANEWQTSGKRVANVLQNDDKMMITKPQVKQPKKLLVFDYSGFSDNEKLAIEKWLVYRKQKRKSPNSELEFVTLRDKLIQFKNRGTLQQVIDNSISNGWTGLFDTNFKENKLTLTNSLSADNFKNMEEF